MNPSHSQLTNPSFLQKLALDLIKPRKSNYIEDCINYYHHQNKFIIQDIHDLKNNYNHKLKASLIKHRQSLLQKVQADFSQNKHHAQYQQKCIVYLHGLGSNRMEGFSILSHLPKNYSLLTFDLSASGKSQGDFTSYGFRQQQDIEAVLNYLIQKKNFKCFIIWGRSMGAVSSLLFNNRMAEKQHQNSSQFLQQSQQGKNQYIPLAQLTKYVKCMIADSPFCSFQNIAKDIALNKMSVPHFFTQIALKFIQGTFQKILFDKKLGINFTPFQIDFTKNKLKPIIPIVFVYSLNDEVVKCQHSEKIIKSIQKSKQKMIQKIIIPECSHNMKRPQIVIETIFQKIQKFCNIKNQKSSTLQIDGQKSNKLKGSQFNKQTNVFSKQTKIVRRKSFWDFQQQFSETKKYDPKDFNLTKNDLKNNVNESHPSANQKTVNQKPTVRRSIFERKQTNQIFRNTQTSTTKKRGLSLSSTIQRTQSVYQQTNQPRKASIQPIKQNSTKFEKSPSKNEKKFIEMSFQLKSNIKNKDQPQKLHSNHLIPPSQRRNINLNESSFQSNFDSRYSLIKNKNKIYLGGSVQGRKINNGQTRQMSLKSKHFKKLGNKSIIMPEQKNYKKLSKQFQFSTISQFGHAYNSMSLIEEIPSKDSSMIVTDGNIPYEFNKTQNYTDYERVSSRQSLRTIDLGVTKGDINESLTSFINNKLQFKFENFDVVNRVFSKTKPNNQDSSLTTKSLESNIILGGKDPKYVSGVRQNKDSGLGQVSFRPSIRLYNQKRKKKVQAQNAIFSRIQENIQITNQRYLIED